MCEKLLCFAIGLCPLLLRDTALAETPRLELGGLEKMRK